MNDLLFEQMISIDHLFQCWNQFRRGKRKKKDVQAFERDLEDNIFQIQEELAGFQYRHDAYHYFYVFDPKERSISKASVRDRLVHQAVYSILTTVFDKAFIFHSLSSRLGKGTHIGVTHLQSMIGKVSANGTKPCYALKMDIKRFFDTVDHQILKTLIRKTIHDEKLLALIDDIIDSFRSKNAGSNAVGIPLGNVTSQLFANIYLHELDHFVKQVLRMPYYLRYCDDFIILSREEHILKALIGVIRGFLQQNLKLELHPKKLMLRKLSQGIDFVGYVLFAKHRLLRTRTKKRMKRRLKEAYIEYLHGRMEADSMNQRLQSYLGILSHATQATLSQALKNAYWTPIDEVHPSGPLIDGVS